MTVAEASIESKSRCRGVTRVDETLATSLRRGELRTCVRR